MYINYVNDRKTLGYKTVKDMNDGIKLVLITKSTILLIRDISLNLKNRSKKKVIVISLSTAVWFSNLEPVDAIGLAIRPTPVPVVRVQASYQHNSHYSQMRIAKKIPIKKNLVTYISSKEIGTLMYLMDPKISSNEQILKVVQNLRGGSWEAALALFGVLFLILTSSSGFIIAPPADQQPGLVMPDPFQPNEYRGRQNLLDKFFRPRRTAGSQSSSSTLQIMRPTDMPHQAFTELTKSARRQLPHPSDIIIDVEGHQQVRVGFYQARFKVVKHGAVHGLIFTIEKDDGTKTLKNDANALSMAQSIGNMPNRSDVTWFEQDDMTYQGGTPGEFPAVCIYDNDTRVAAIFEKDTGNFVTTYQLTPEEETELIENHNLGGGKDWFSGKAKNLPPEGIAMNAFEKDVNNDVNVTAIRPRYKNSSPNPVLGFTPRNSFESDVMRITPINKSYL